MTTERAEAILRECVARRFSEPGWFDVLRAPALQLAAEGWTEGRLRAEITATITAGVHARTVKRGDLERGA